MRRGESVLAPASPPAPRPQVPQVGLPQTDAAQLSPSEGSSARWRMSRLLLGAVVSRLLGQVHPLGPPELTQPP